MAEEATLQEESVSELETEEVQATTNPRMELMERMREKRKADMVPGEPRKDDGGGEKFVQEDEQVIVSEDENGGAQDNDAQVSDEPEKPSAPVYERDGKWYAKRKVNGKEEEVEYERMLADSQKNVSADFRLEQAAQERKRLDHDRLELAAKQEELRKRQEQVQAPQDEKKLDDLLKKRFDAMLVYNEDDTNEEAFKAYRDAELEVQSFQSEKAQPAAPVIDRKELVAEVKAEAKWEMKRDNYNKNLENANTWLYNEQQDLDVKDEYLNTLAESNAKKILSERLEQGRLTNPAFDVVDVDPIQVYKDAVSQTKTWLTAKAGNATTSARIARKRSSTGRSVTGSNARATIEDNTPKIKSQSERIADMRKARGLST